MPKFCSTVSLLLSHNMLPTQIDGDIPVITVDRRDASVRERCVDGFDSGVVPVWAAAPMTRPAKQASVIAAGRMASYAKYRTPRRPASSASNASSNEGSRRGSSASEAASAITNTTEIRAVRFVVSVCGPILQ